MKKYELLSNNLRESIMNGSLVRGTKLPTEEKLSAETGFSRQTVRLALKILEEENLIIKKHGSGSYVNSASFLPGTRRIAVISRFFNHYFFPSLIEGVETAAAEANYSVVLHATHNDVVQERNLLCSILEDNIDGILAYGCCSALPNPNLDIYRELLAKDIPIVFINSYYKEFFQKPLKKCVYVSIDDETASYEITSALIASGHTKIGAVMKYEEIFGHQRCAGYMRAMIEHGIPVTNDSVLWFGSKDDITEILRDSPLIDECTALMLYNDLTALKFFDLSEDIRSNITAVGSFDGTACNVPENILFFSRPNPVKQMGKIATEKLIHIIKGQQENSELIPMKQFSEGDI